MEITNFLNAETIITFAMTMVIVELWVGFTKELSLIKKIPTRLYTFILAAVHLSIINTSIVMFEYTVIGVYVLLCNALILSVILTGGYDIVTNKITINKK